MCGISIYSLDVCRRAKGSLAPAPTVHWSTHILWIRLVPVVNDSWSGIWWGEWPSTCPNTIPSLVDSFLFCCQFGYSEAASYCLQATTAFSVYLLHECCQPSRSVDSKTHDDSDSLSEKPNLLYQSKCSWLFYQTLLCTVSSNFSVHVFSVKVNYISSVKIT